MFATNTFMEIQWWGEFTIPFLSPLFPPENRQKINNIYFFEHLILAFVNSVQCVLSLQSKTLQNQGREEIQTI